MANDRVDTWPSPSYDEAVAALTTLSEGGENSEYARGQAELIAYLWRKDDTELAEVAAAVAKDAGMTHYDGEPVDDG